MYKKNNKVTLKLWKIYCGGDRSETILHVYFYRNKYSL